MVRETVGVEYTDGSRYVGQIKDGKRHGRGELFDSEGSPIYKGGWAHGEREGHGRHYKRGKLEYSGEWQGGKPHGYGTQYSINGCKSEYKERGWWIKGRKEGVFKQYRDGAFCRRRFWSGNYFYGYPHWGKPGTPVDQGGIPEITDNNKEFLSRKNFALKVTFDSIAGRCVGNSTYFRVDFDSPHPEFGSKFITKPNPNNFSFFDEVEEEPLVWWIEDGVLHSDGREFQILHGHGESEEWVEGALPTVEEMRENTGIVWKGKDLKKLKSDFDSIWAREWIGSLRTQSSGTWECPACSNSVLVAKKRCQCGWRRSGQIFREGKNSVEGQGDMDKAELLGQRVDYKDMTDDW